MNWTIFAEVIYVILIIAVCLRIIYDTRSTTKTLAYLLLAIFVPVFGVIFYFSFGINYRKRKMYSKKLINDDNLLQTVNDFIRDYSQHVLYGKEAEIKDNKELARLLLNDNQSPLTDNNNVKLLLNGENKFPEVLQALKEAKHHIHIEYYIYDNDEIGNQIKDILIEKAKEGVEVRFLYDHFGSSSIQRKLVPKLIKGGVPSYPFYKIKFLFLANRLNYRNHRKIIIIDGRTAFVGGINVSDRYINNGKYPLFWRDTHIRIDGPGVYYLQYLFMCDWNFCAKNHQLEPGKAYFNKDLLPASNDNIALQIAASGPDSDNPTILFSILQAINLAKEEILITSPYFIPGESLLDAMVVASLSGLRVKLLVPKESDSVLVNSAAQSYYGDLLRAGVEIYLYTKGFVHAKTLVADGKVAIVGTANMDYRSFELNFEVNAIVYDTKFSAQLREAFYNDLMDSEKMDIIKWNNRPVYKKLLQKVARLLSPML